MEIDLDVGLTCCATDCTGASKDDTTIVGVVCVAKLEVEDWVVNGVMHGGGGVGRDVVSIIGEESTAA